MVSKALPADACLPISTAARGKLVVAVRGNCDFYEKVRTASAMHNLKVTGLTHNLGQR